jgi:hypothetical protein
LFRAKADAYNLLQMTKKRRQAHIPQQTTRRRRVARRPDFTTAPEPEERVDLDGNPIFAEDVSPDAIAYTGISGPVETRPHWIGNTAQPQAQSRQPGRRVAQLRGGASDRAPRITAGQLPTFEAGYLHEELRRIAITSGTLFLAIIVLALIMR